MEAQFNFLRVKDGIPSFARVTVSSDPRIDGIKLSQTAATEVPSFKTDWLEAARLGAEKALRAHIQLGGSKIGLEIVDLLGTEVDTRKDAVEVAAFCAAWKALGRDESMLNIESNDHWTVSQKVKN